MDGTPLNYMAFQQSQPQRRVELVLTGRGWRQLGPSPDDRDGDLPTGAKRVELRLYDRELIRLDLQ